MSLIEQKDVPNRDESQNDPAFIIDSLNPATGEVVIIIQKGIVGALSNQLKNTSNRRKASSILRKLGYVLSDCGNILYGGNITETDLDPNILITDKESTGLTETNV